MKTVQDAGDGIYIAASVGGGVLDKSMVEVVRQFNRLETEAAKAAFADSWLQSASEQLAETWPMYYQLLCIIRDHELYSKPEYMCGQITYASFEEYFERVAKRPFQVWTDLERTYQFAQKGAPGLFSLSLEEAKAAEEDARTAKVIAAANSAQPRNPGNPNQNKKLPKMTKNPGKGRQEDRAYVTIDSQRKYLGKWGTKEAEQNYNALIESLSNNGANSGAKSGAVNSNNVRIDCPSESKKPGSNRIERKIAKIAKKAANPEDPDQEKAVEVLDELKQGKRTNASQALRDAGDKAPKRITLAPDPHLAGKALAKKFTSKERGVILSYILDEISEEDVASALRLCFKDQKIRKRVAELLLA